LSETTLLLVAQFQAGEREAFGELYQEFAPQVRNFLWLMLGDADAADDLLQEVMVSAWRDRSQLRAAPAFHSWLLGIARHAGLAELRRRRRQPISLDQSLDAEEEGAFPLGLEIAGQGPLPNAELVQAKRNVVLNKAMEVLRPKEREIVMMTYYLDLKQREIADALGVPLGSVGTTLRRALEKMQEEIERQGLNFESLQ